WYAIGVLSAIEPSAEPPRPGRGDRDRCRWCQGGRSPPAKRNRQLRLKAGFDADRPAGLAPARRLGHDGT
ncbi:MAG: hypothetical protein OXD30_06415, partial [Bryobacterales bacterium]|nr:hypothetical protein [Bryobacterales bacterium]